MDARAQAAEPAFSDDEFEGIDMEGVGSRSRNSMSSPVSPKEEDVYEVNIMSFSSTNAHRSRVCQQL